MKNKTFVTLPKSLSRSFTLIELIVVIIIVGILAAVGLTQYSTIVEKGRLAEAKVRIGAMSKLAYEYYLNNGTYVGITNADIDVDNTCHSTDYYRYNSGAPSATQVLFYAYRCTSLGKSPQAPGVYGLFWWFNSNGLQQGGYYVVGGGWVYTSNWGGCCR